MRLICPYVPTMLAGRTRQWIQDHDGDFVDVSRSDEAYWALLARQWRAGESFVLIEHDIVPSEAAYRSLKSCRSGDWCLCPYPVAGNLVDGALGCVRFAAPLMDQHLDAIERVMPNERGWAVLCGGIARVLVQECGLKPHIHRDHPAEHLHCYPSVT